MADVERTHLGTPTTAGRTDGETHLVVDIHERQWTRCGGTGTRHERAFRAKCRELITDTTSRAQRQPRLVRRAQDVIHGITDGLGHGAVDGAGGRFMLERAGVAHDATRWDRTLQQGPLELLLPLFAHRRLFDFRQCTSNALVGVVDGFIHRDTFFGFETVLLVPDVEACALHRNLRLATSTWF